MRSKPLRWLIYTLLSIVLAPVIVFNSGLVLAGDYEGESGFLGFVGSLYAAAAGGRFSAWVVLLAPVLILLIWATVRWHWTKAASYAEPAAET